MSDFYHASVGHNRFFIDVKYQNLKPIGDGSYGVVASAFDTKSGQMVAIKKIKNAFQDLVDAKRILRELKLLRHFSSHENIITILDIVTVPPYQESFDDIYIVTNLMESDLERIIRSRQDLTDQHFQYFLYQILRGLKYLHSANVLHRDLKPSNLLVNANCDLALCDFGLARGFNMEGMDSLTEYVVTRWYRAPELLCESTKYGKSVDIWGVGCIFAELLVHEAFFQGSSPLHQLESIVKLIGCPPRHKLNFVYSRAALNSILKYEGYTGVPAFASLFPPHVNPLAIDLLQKMLTFNPDDRVTVNEALRHEYLKSFHGQMAEPEARELFDFDFEGSGLGEELSRSEVQRLMYQEMLRYRSPSDSMMSSDSKIGDDDDFLDAFEGPQGGGDSMVVSPVGSQAKSGHGDYDRYEK
jgi:mitogen-activated protein kinase 1/3